MALFFFYFCDYSPFYTGVLWVVYFVHFGEQDAARIARIRSLTTGKLPGALIELLVQCRRMKRLLPHRAVGGPLLHSPALAYLAKPQEIDVAILRDDWSSGMDQLEIAPPCEPQSSDSSSESGTDSETESREESTSESQ